MKCAWRVNSNETVGAWLWEGTYGPPSNPLIDYFQKPPRRRTEVTTGRRGRSARHHWGSSGRSCRAQYMALRDPSKHVGMCIVGIATRASCPTPT